LEEVVSPLLRRQLFVACALLYPLATNAALSMVSVLGSGWGGGCATSPHGFACTAAAPVFMTLAMGLHVHFSSDLSNASACLRRRPCSRVAVHSAGCSSHPSLPTCAIFSLCFFPGELPIGRWSGRPARVLPRQQHPTAVLQGRPRACVRGPLWACACYLAGWGSERVRPVVTTPHHCFFRYLYGLLASRRVMLQRCPSKRYCQPGARID
jgi:hypothetical protein